MAHIKIFLPKLKIDDLSDRLRLGMAKMQAAIGETSAAASGRMISLEEVSYQ